MAVARQGIPWFGIVFEESHKKMIGEVGLRGRIETRGGQSFHN